MRGAVIVVSNASRARVLHLRGGRLEALATLDHPSSRERDRALLSDRPGRTWTARGGNARLRGGAFGQTGQARTAMQEASAQSLEHERFAREVADTLKSTVDPRDDLDVVLLAPPQFLGRLRAVLGPTVAGRAVVTLAADHTASSDARLLEVLDGLGVRGARVATEV